MGSGKRIEIPARPIGLAGTDLQRMLSLEVYDQFPNILLSTVQYRNTGSGDLVLEKCVDQRHRMSAQLVDTKARPWDVWSFHGSSSDWGKDDVVKLTKTFSQPNVMGEMVKGGYGGGTPVVAFWTRQVGEAVGHVETLPISASIPTQVDKDGRVNSPG
jgi:alpha-galactosidase